MKCTSMLRVMQALLAGVVLAAAGAQAHEGARHARSAFDPAHAEQKEFGRAGNPREATRVIKLAMDDKMRFMPNAITVRQGETVKFIVVNNGRMLHEMVIGTMQELKEHAEQMKKFPDMEHDEAHMVHVKPSNKGLLTWTFNRPGDFHFACLIPGHFEAGMVGTIKVLAAGETRSKP